MNPAAERLFEISLSAARGQRIEELIGEKHPILHALMEVFQTGRTTRLHEITLETKSGSKRLGIEMAPLGSIEQPEAGLLFLTEESLQQAFQEENRLQDRLQMMGTLASGLAHEIRNPLGGIRGAAQMIARETKQKDFQEYAHIIIRETDRLNQLITQLLDFSKPKRVRKGPVNIHKLLTEILKLEQNHLKKQGIQMIQSFDPSLPSVRGHGPSLKQAFLNLIKNAIEAMPQGGTLKIKTQVSSEKRLIKEGSKGTAAASNAESLAEISIQDSGVGISIEEQASLFTPFFTTKPSGTGLGLMMVQRIVKEHQGTLKVSSEVGQGSLFSVFLRLAI